MTPVTIFPLVKLVPLLDFKVIWVMTDGEYETVNQLTQLLASSVKLVHVIPVSVTEPIRFRAVSDVVILLPVRTLTTIALIPDKTPFEFRQS